MKKTLFCAAGLSADLSTGLTAGLPASFSAVLPTGFSAMKGMTRKVFAVLALVICCCSLYAQQPEGEISYFDRKWKPASEKKAVYLLRVRQTKDGLWQFSYYNKLGPAVRIESYADRNKSVKQGAWTWFDEQGKMDSTGHYDQGLPNGQWYFPGLKVDPIFEKGRMLTNEEKTAYLKKQWIKDPQFPDLSRRTPESYFPGGDSAWKVFLNKNLHYPMRAISNEIDGIVFIRFCVTPSGKLEEIGIKQSVELSLDDEAMELVSKSPDWVPAIRYEHKVQSYIAQPIVFKLSVK